MDLEVLYDYDKDALVRESVVEALGRIGGNKAIQALEDFFSDEDEEVREGAAEAIKIMTDPKKNSLP